jgi:hypothetical protein
MYVSEQLWASNSTELHKVFGILEKKETKTKSEMLWEKSSPEEGMLGCARRREGKKSPRIFSRRGCKTCKC